MIDNINKYLWWTVMGMVGIILGIVAIITWAFVVAFPYLVVALVLFGIGKLLGIL